MQVYLHPSWASWGLRRITRITASILVDVPEVSKRQDHG